MSVLPVARDPYAAYAQPCYAPAQRIVADPVVAQSIVDEVFAIWTAPRHPDPGHDDPAPDNPARASAAAQLIATVHRRAVEHTRAHDTSPGRGNDLRDRMTLTAEVGHPPLMAGDDRSRRRVVTALAALPEEQRAPILLAYLGGLTQTQIAHQLNIPLGMVRSRTRQGMTRLGHHLSAPSGRQDEPDADPAARAYTGLDGDDDTASSLWPSP